MNEKYKSIIDTVTQFRALSRLHIEKLFFAKNKNSKNDANAVLKKLVDRGYLSVNKNFQPYVYHSANSKIKKQGQKINQYLGIVDNFLDLLKYGNIRYFEVEPRFKYGDYEVRPDLYLRWRGNLWAIESMSSPFSNKQITEKNKRYEGLYLSGKYKELPFQGESKKVMPIVFIVGAGVPYSISSKHIRIIQSKSIDEFMERFQEKQKQVRALESGGIQIKIG